MRNLRAGLRDDRLYGGQGDDCVGADCAHNADSSLPFQNEDGDDFLKSRDHVAGNDDVDGGNNTDTCVVDAGDLRAVSAGTDLSCEEGG